MARYKELAVLLVSIMLAGVFSLTGGMKLFGSADMVASFARWGYGPGFMYAVGTFELLCVAALLVPRANFLGAAGLALVMAGAIWTHVTHAEYTVIAVPIALLFLAAWTAWTTRPQALGGPLKLRQGEFAAAMPDEHARPSR
jgi:uncharacterized membrane protein YphA (DoxX/SURF4 family)